MGQQLGFYLNQQFCMGCKTCAVACKDKNDMEIGVNLRRLTEVSGGGFAKVGDTYVPEVFAYWIGVSCNHCDHPKCVENCPTGAMHKNPEDGVVSVDQTKCIGCRYCTWSCPYGAPQYSEQRGKTQKCDMCADYRAQGKDPACVTSCPMRAIEWGPIDELKKKHPDAVVAVHGLPDPLMTSPNTIYTSHKSAVSGGRK
ncbi:MAG: 4Fe-4S ferredoxin [Symbiobacteriaceae bacterium]|nr:4Fe-4S ferredoxin [Symbiobacteriaceae bacterium]